ncbi:D-alanine--D-alanine ligase [Desulfonema ishimotonii]|uniref:D-alanine--D-alanine ligase n=1 Tax=Desulfonema ishimotonii TaxID=45657 RepID=A0A401FWC6_9BACT|nr:methyltransferase domain-containing protein [Desulfonema ishimotonii]GBC61261.1 D-alanine--D-alanine ligase [Desulfonema ishimotonii]
MAKNVKSQKTKWKESLGPVEDLESYVRADWWRNIFNANYLRTDGDVVEDETITRSEVDTFIGVLAPSEDSAILDLCCGQGRHALEFARRGFTSVFGLDRSHYLIVRARKINNQEGTNVTFKEGDARKLPFASDTFDHIIIAGNSFGYFESLQDDLKILSEVRRILKPGGKILLDVTDGDYMRKEFQPRSWEWIDKKYFVCRERSLSKDGERIISREVITHVKKGVIADQFYAERLYSGDSLRELFQQANFEDIEFHTEIRADSKRDQDLGMMARRLVVSAAVKKELTIIRRPDDERKTIAVLMGDPGKSDVVKPNANFDNDDFFTINELKKALTGITEYNFIYLNQHDKLLNELLKMKCKPDFVFNLCDEGFNNEASKELHIPSLLEVLNLPYTGGTPQCLAYCYDKSLVRGIAKEMDIPVPRAFIVKPEDTVFIELTLDFPVIVKPNFGDSSFGITQHNVCHDIQSLENAISQVRKKFGYNRPILVEQLLTGKDISVGIIGNPPESYLVLPVIEEDYSALPPDLPRICGYEAKWHSDSPYWKIKSVPANLPEETERFLIASCIKLFERLECRDYARFDWRLDANGTPRLLEANPNPGWCWDGHLAKMANFAGISYPEMLQKILKAGEERIATGDDGQGTTGAENSGAKCAQMVSNSLI